jgi:cytochrome bd-type quinol oxidase subunit 1
LRSFAVAAGFGLASTLSVIVLGDESGYTAGEKTKLALIEAEWKRIRRGGNHGVRLSQPGGGAH